MDKSDDFVAHASATVEAPTGKVWKALVKPEMIREYMMGANVISDWKPGSEIVWEGEWEGKKYQDKGTIVKIEPERLLQYTHFSPLTGQADVPENYHTVTIELADHGPRTRVTLTQDNNETEEAQAHSEKNWNSMLDGLRAIVETP